MVFYLAVVIWLGSWVMSFAFTLVLFFVIAYSLWLALMWQAMLQSSLHGLCVRGSGDKTSCKLTMTVHVTYLDLERGQCSYFQSLVPRFHHFQIWLLTICEANDGFIPWVQYPHFQPLPPPVSANTEILWVAKVHVAKRAIKNWWWESSGMPRNENQHVHLARSTETKTLHLHFHFQFPFPVSISSLSSSFHFQFTFPVYVSSLRFHSCFSICTGMNTLSCPSLFCDNKGWLKKNSRRKSFSTLAFERIFTAAATIYQESYFWMRLRTVRQELFAFLFWPNKFSTFESVAMHDLIHAKKFFKKSFPGICGLM